MFYFHSSRLVFHDVVDDLLRLGGGGKILQIHSAIMFQGVSSVGDGGQARSLWLTGSELYQTVYAITERNLHFSHCYI